MDMHATALRSSKSPKIGGGILSCSHGRRYYAGLVKVPAIEAAIAHVTRQRTRTFSGRTCCYRAPDPRRENPEIGKIKAVTKSCVMAPRVRRLTTRSRCRR